MIRIIANIFRYLYFHLFLLWGTKLQKHDDARWNAILSLSLLLCFYSWNLISILAYVDLLDSTIKWYELNEGILNVFIFPVFTIINWYFLGRREMHEKIVLQFAEKNTNERRFGMIVSAIFCLVAISFMFDIF